MPIYEYLCNECEHQFDALQKMSDDPLKDCPECQQPALTKLVSAPSFRLSGTGWYETDFKTDKDKKKNLTDSAKSDKTGSKTEDKKGSKKDKSDSKSEKSKKADNKSASSTKAQATA